MKIRLFLTLGRWKHVQSDLAPDCINQPLGNVNDTDVFGGTCGKREKGSFCFLCSWALLPALKKNQSENFSLNFSFPYHLHQTLLPGSEPSPGKAPVLSCTSKGHPSS